jgi:hypothetical protein
MKTKKIMLWTMFLVIANLQNVCKAEEKKYLLYGKAIAEETEMRVPVFSYGIYDRLCILPDSFRMRDQVYPIQPSFKKNFTIPDSNYKSNPFLEVWHSFDLSIVDGISVKDGIPINRLFSLGYVQFNPISPSLFTRKYYSFDQLRFLCFSTSGYLDSLLTLSDTLRMFMSVCPNHNATVKSLGTHSSFRKNDVITLEVNGNFPNYLDNDFVWDYSLDGIHFQRRKSVDFFGRTLSITYDDIPGALLGQPIYFRLKHCGQPYIPSNNAGSLPVVFTILPEFPEFLDSLYVTDIRCPNQAPQPLFLPFNRNLGTNESITEAYLFSEVIDGRVLNRIDLEFSPTAGGLTIYFDQVLPDKDYFLQMEGNVNGVSISSTSTTIRVRNPESLKFEKIISPSSGTEYHQGIP